MTYPLGTCFFKNMAEYSVHAPENQDVIDIDLPNELLDLERSFSSKSFRISGSTTPGTIRPPDGMSFEDLPTDANEGAGKRTRWGGEGYG